MEAAARRPGRPAKGDTAMTGAQRVAMTRQRAREAAQMAYENLATATDKAIFQNLQAQIRRLDTDPDQAEAWRAIAGQLMAELARRHGIMIR